MYPDAALTVEYHRPGRGGGCALHDWRDVLGLVRLAASGSPGNAAAVPTAHVAAPTLGEQAAVFEVWRSAGAQHCGADGRIRYRSNHAVLFGCVEVHEEEAPARLGDATALEWATATAYREMFRCLEARRFLHLWRIWNYLPDINRETGGTERYRQFNAARQRAFREAGRDVEFEVPAACALGLGSRRPLLVYFLAGAAAGTPIENPRQVAAYHYPREYGPASPTFARAMLAGGSHGATLLVSGTSSIVGHRTVHAGDVIAQTRETVANIRALLAEASRHAGGATFALEQLAYKVYLRHERDLRACAAELSAALGPQAPIVFVRADVCRAELLVEIEAVGCGRPAAGA
jgi:enamine deaminase RidA (YjgF/YER057c/UK114 family)